MYLDRNQIKVVPKMLLVPNRHSLTLELSQTKKLPKVLLDKLLARNHLRSLLLQIRRKTLPSPLSMGLETVPVPRTPLEQRLPRMLRLLVDLVSMQMRRQITQHPGVLISVALRTKQEDFNLVRSGNSEKFNQC